MQINAIVLFLETFQLIIIERPRGRHFNVQNIWFTAKIKVSFLICSFFKLFLNS